MPLTFPAHQALVLPLKLWRPRLVDGTALCVAAAAPDLAYPLGSWPGRQSHTAIGIAVWAVPCTVVVCAALRWRVAAGLFAQLPDAGSLRLRSYRVLRRRRPAVVVTLLSAVVGGVSHVLIDGFTHEGRWGAGWLGLDQVIGAVPGRGEVTAARALQYVGHVCGTAAGVALFVHVGRRRLLERWYGRDAVAADRRVAVSPRQRLLFWSLALLPPLAAAAWTTAHDRNPIFATITATAAGLVLAGGLPLHEPAPAPAPGGGPDRAVRVRRTGPSGRRWRRRRGRRPRRAAPER